MTTLERELEKLKPEFKFKKLDKLYIPEKKWFNEGKKAAIAIVRKHMKGKVLVNEKDLLSEECIKDINYSDYIFDKSTVKELRKKLKALTGKGGEA